MNASPLFALLLFGLAQVQATEAPLTNRLSGDPSPYLALHAQDPVHWQRWGAQTFARAQREGKLLLVSSGYFSCHWCHVMQRESFHDPQIAAFINRHFIPVKVDRQQQPAVDAGLVDFTEGTLGQAGWPLNVFLTPEGYPLLGSLYLPAEDFAALLRRLQARWTKQADALTALARTASQAASAVAPDRNGEAEKTSKSLWRDLRERALNNADELQGGFGAQAKFPMAPQLLVLLQAYQREPQPELAEFLGLTLRQMANGGLQYQLGGGFFRYTTDPDWHTPHFEKMLYDNALLVSVYLRAARVLAAPEFLDVARRTLDFVLDNLHAPDGGYFAALSAVDGDGVEGGAYLWDRSEIEHLAGRHWPLVRRFWRLDGAQPFAAGYLPVPQSTVAQLAAASGITASEAGDALETVRERLLQRRASRRIPVDTQVLTGWNGLLLWALADAVEFLETDRKTDRYRRAAQSLQGIILRQFQLRGELLRVHRDSRGTDAGTLEDYAYVVTGLLRWQEVSGSTPESRAQVRQLLEQAWKRFYAAGGWRLGDALGEDALLRWGRSAVAFADGPMPSPHALLLVASRQANVQPEQTAAAVRAALPWVDTDTFAFASYVALYP